MFNIFKKRNEFLEETKLVLDSMRVSEKVRNLVLETFGILDRNYDVYSSFNGIHENKVLFQKGLLKTLKTITSIEIDDTIDAKEYEAAFKEVKFSLDKGNNRGPETKRIYNHKAIYNNTIADKVTSSIKVINSPISLWYAMILLKPRYFEVDSSYAYSKVLRRIMIEASIDSEMSLLRDFNGYIWDRVYTNVMPYQFNIIYNNILMLVGHEFITLWKESHQGSENHLKYIYSILEKKSKDNDALDKYINTLNSMIYLIADKSERETIDAIVESNKESLELMKDSKKFSQYLAAEKESLNKYIRNIDAVINDSKKMLEAFSKRKANKIIDEVDNNEKLSNDEKKSLREKINLEYNINDYRELLENERKNAKGKIKDYNSLQNPDKFMSYKKEIINQINVQESIKNLSCVSENGDVNNKALEKLVIEQQKQALDLVYCYITKLVDPNEIYFNLLMIRKIRFLQYGDNVYGFSNVDLYQKMDKILKSLINAGVESKLILKASENINDNYAVTSHAFKTSIADFNNIQISVYKGRTILLNIYNDGALNNEIELFDIAPESILLNSRKKIDLLDSSKLNKR